MIIIDLKTHLDYKYLQRKLGSTAEEAKKILVQSLNATAKRSLPVLQEHAQKTYDVQGSSFVKGKGKNAYVRIINANKNKLISQVRFSGHKLNIKQFNTDIKSKPQTPPKDGIRGKVLKTSSLKNLTKYGNKAFWANFKNGGSGIIVRSSKERYPTKSFLAPSIPQLVGSKKIVANISPKVGDFLAEEVNKRMDKYLRAKANK